MSGASVIEVAFGSITTAVRWIAVEGGVPRLNILGHHLVWAGTRRLEHNSALHIVMVSTFQRGPLVGISLFLPEVCPGILHR